MLATHKTPAPFDMDGWRIMPRVHRDLRRPGARHTFDCDDYYEYEDPYYAVPVEGSRLDRYVASKLPDADYDTRHTLMMDFWDLPSAQDRLLNMATHLTKDYAYFLSIHRRARKSFCEYLRSAVECIVLEWDEYEEMRMGFIRRWFNCADTQMPTLEQQRQFEKEAWYWDNRYDRHKLALAARRRLARVVVGRLLRMAVKHRALALYWQERTQRALCAPGGAGRAADKGAFESEFA